MGRRPAPAPRPRASGSRAESLHRAARRRRPRCPWPRRASIHGGVAPESAGAGQRRAKRSRKPAAVRSDLAVLTDGEVLEQLHGLPGPGQPGTCPPVRGLGGQVLPSSTTLPLWAVNPEMASTVVVLPAPLGPISPTSSPGPIQMSTSVDGDDAPVVNAEPLGLQQAFAPSAGTLRQQRGEAPCRSGEAHGDQHHGPCPAAGCRPSAAPSRRRPAGGRSEGQDVAHHHGRAEGQDHPGPEVLSEERARSRPGRGPPPGPRVRVTCRQVCSLGGGAVAPRRGTGRVRATGCTTVRGTSGSAAAKGPPRRVTYRAIGADLRPLDVGEVVEYRNIARKVLARAPKVDDTDFTDGFAPVGTQPGQRSEGHVISLQTHRHQRLPGAGAL